jgi:hypothetical protein
MPITRPKDGSLTGEWMFWRTIASPLEWLAVIDWTPEAVTAAATVLLGSLTFVLAFGTLFLWFATQRLVRGSEKTAERQLRAYISISPTNVNEFGEGGNVTIHYDAKNVGKTPAVKVKTFASVAILPFPFPLGMISRQSPKTRIKVSDIHRPRTADRRRRARRRFRFSPNRDASLGPRAPLYPLPFGFARRAKPRHLL